MPNTKRAKKPQFTTPRGVWKFPRLATADTKFKADGEYSVKVVLPKADAAKLIADLKPLHAAAVKAAPALFAELKPETRKKLKAKNGDKGYTVNPFYTEEVDEDEKPTGNVEFVFKMTASGEYKSGPKAGQKWSRKPVMFNAKGEKINVNPWGGSEGKVTFEVGFMKDQETPGYFIPGTGAVGIKLGLEAVQILKLVQGGERDASGYGFGQEEGEDIDPSTETETQDAADDTAEGKDKPGADDKEEF